MRAMIRAMAVLALVGAAACGRPAEADTPAARPEAAIETPQVVTVTASDFSFQAPDSVEAGLVTIRMVNRGPDLHHVWLVRLDEGKTLADVAALPHGAPQPAWMVDVGGPNAVPGGSESSATLRLEPGTYALLCHVAGGDGVPHVRKGMMRVIRVVGAALPAAAPRADVQMTLADYGFGWEGPMKHGERVIRVVNNAAQPHEVVMVKLAPGRTAADVLAWLQSPRGAPPGVPVGGVTGLAQGMENYITVNLEKGQYALFCFVPDAGDGKPHIAHGMIRTLTIE